jgi:tetratricopeptide (TPR) repeat protein
MSSVALDQRVEAILKKSRISFVLTAVIAVTVAGTLLYCTHRILQLSDIITSKNIEISEKSTELSALQNQLRDARDNIDKSMRGLNILNEGTRFLFNRQYAEATASFNNYLKLFPGDARALNFAGYSELRYAKYMRDLANDPKATKNESISYNEEASTYYERSIEHLASATNDKTYFWPRYNLALLYAQAGENEKAMDELQSLLSDSPGITKWLCEDGQFRKMRLNSTTADRFTSYVRNAADKVGIVQCWVISDVRPKAV